MKQFRHGSIDEWNKADITHTSANHGLIKKSFPVANAAGKLFIEKSFKLPESKCSRWFSIR